MGLDKKSTNLLLSHGSTKDLIDEYLADVAMFTLRKLPAELQRQATVDRGDREATLDADGMTVEFTYDQRQGEVNASVRTDSDFSFPVARRGGVKRFSIGLEDSGIKLVSQVLSHLGTF